MADEKELQAIKHLLDTAENNIRQVKSVLFASEITKKAKGLEGNEDGTIVEGVFDGENMIGPDKTKYPIPANYASKSKLIPGDVLKLTILEDGTFLFKQIGPVKRKKIIGELEEISEGKYIVNAEGKKYRILLASVTYFKAENGSKLTIIVPEKGESEWAAVENLL
ncbi:MAG: hypothetical protein M1324_04675 [Patescibacteria group bacterium]|nr:hypothetical protein [Patescibacteria group bacterium]